jgi:hypothetical protein
MILDSPYISGSIVIENSLTASNAVFSGNLNITGDITSTEGFTGSLEGTASVALNAISSSHALNADNAVSSSFAATSSFADSFTVAGEIVAQTLNVQQVTSSVVYSSGSNVFGNSLSNTQVFTGSLQVTGSTHYLLGNVGIGGTPTHKLYVRNDVAASTDLDPTSIKLYNNSDGGAAIEFSNGVVGNSKISFGVEGTGASTDETYIGFSTNVNGATAVERMRIGSNGNVKIVNGGDLEIYPSTGSSYTSLYNDNDNFIVWNNGSERMRINSSGNVGIGETNPASYKLQVKGPDGQGIQYEDSNGVRTLLGSYVNESIIGTLTNHAVGFWSNNSKKMTLTTGGNLGLGVTPSAWGTLFNVLQSHYGTYFGASTSGGSVMGNNNYYNGANYIYTNSDYATQYQQASGTHFWRISTSGTAGNAISFTQAMTLNASGNLSIGNTNDTYKLDVSGTGRFTGTIYGGGNIEVVNAGGPYILVGEGTGVNQYGAIDWDATNNRLRIATQPYAFGASGGQITLTTDGYVGIGTTAPANGKLEVKQTSNDATHDVKIQAVFGPSGYLDSDSPNAFGAGLSETQFINGATNRPAMISLGGNLQVNEALGVINFFASNNDANYRSRAFISGGYQNTGTAGKYGGDLWFYTASDSAMTPSPRIRITPDGYVGIGVTSVPNFLTISTGLGGSPANLSELEPYATVKIKGRVDRDNILYIGAKDALTGMLLQSGTTSTAHDLLLNPFGGNVGIGTTSPNQLLHVNGTSQLLGADFGIAGNSDFANYAIKGDAGGSVLIYNWYSGHIFQTNGGSEKMRITNAGNVGIGTTSPSFKLSVVGAIQANELYLNGSYTNSYSTTDAGWNGNWVTVIPPDTLDTNFAYLVSFKWTNGGTGQPYELNGASIMMTANTNSGSGTGTEIYINSISHTGGTDNNIQIRSSTGAGQVSNGLQIKLTTSGSLSSGTLYVKATRMMQA